MAMLNQALGLESGADNQMCGCAALTRSVLRDVLGKADLQRVPSKNNIWENGESGAARFSDSFLGLECVPLSVRQPVNVQWLRGVMMLLKGKRCAIMRMDFIQQIAAETSVTWTRFQNFGCLFKVTQLPRAARRG